MGKDVIIACDFSSAQQTFDFLDKFTEEKPFVKIGMELFYAEGPSIVREIKKRGHKIFLDLKLHDIPNTVKKSMAVLSKLDVDMTNVHAAGTIDMMKAALEGLTREDGTRPLLIAVTQLTSTSEERMQNELLINASINDTIVKYAQNAKEAGLELRPTTVLVFGSPKVGTGLMQADQSISLELPLRISIWEDEAGSTWLAFPRIPRMAAEYGLEKHPVVGKMERLMEELVRKAGSVY